MISCCKPNPCRPRRCSSRARRATRSRPPACWLITYICIHIYIYMHMYTYIYIYHTYMYIYMCVYIYICIHILHTYIYIYTYTYIYIYIYMYELRLCYTTMIKSRMWTRSRDTQESYAWLVATLWSMCRSNALDSDREPSHWYLRDRYLWQQSIWGTQVRAFDDRA